MRPTPSVILSLPSVILSLPSVILSLPSVILSAAKDQVPEMIFRCTANDRQKQPLRSLDPINFSTNRPESVRELALRPASGRA